MWIIDRVVLMMIMVLMMIVMMIMVMTMMMMSHQLQQWLSGTLMRQFEASSDFEIVEVGGNSFPVRTVKIGRAHV